MIRSYSAGEDPEVWREIYDFASSSPPGLRMLLRDNAGSRVTLASADGACFLCFRTIATNCSWSSREVIEGFVLSKGINKRIRRSSPHALSAVITARLSSTRADRIFYRHEADESCNLKFNINNSLRVLNSRSR